MGISDFRPGQLETIVDVYLLKMTILFLMPTGGGKSMLFVLPCMLCLGTILVVMPMLSLIEDKINELERLRTVDSVGRAF